MFDRMSTACGPLILWQSGRVLSRHMGANDPRAQLAQPDPLPNVAQWGQLPAGREWGNATRSTWTRRVTSGWPTSAGPRAVRDEPNTRVMELDAAGAVLRSSAAACCASPHGIHVDTEGNVWVTDAPGPGVAGGPATSDKGRRVMKFSPDGKLLLTLGKAGVMGTDTGTFNEPADVAVAPNGDFFVADGHGNARIVKFSKDGRFIKEWGKKGTGPGEFDVPHATRVRLPWALFVGDRGNSRIQIFDQEGQLLAEWRAQFGRPRAASSST